MCSFFYYKISVILISWVQAAKSMSIINKNSYFMDNSGSDSDVADFIVSKGYLPSDKDLPKNSIVKNVDKDMTYLLSKLSDEELIKLLNDQPKKNVYDLNDIVKVAIKTKPLEENKLLLDMDKNNSRENQKHKFRTLSQKAFFRLDDKQVKPFNVKNDADPNYNMALQKINNLLYSRPTEDIVEMSAEDDEKKELLFDILVNQLKTLCCKKRKSSRNRSYAKKQYKSLLYDLISKQDTYAHITNDKNPNEYMFLIVNDEIKSNTSDEIISVDPDSLEKNSSVLLLGPISTPLTDIHLKSVMNRISNELSKPDYLPLLQQLSDGTLSNDKVKLMKSLVTGPETRRYIKPHRCNYQSPLAKVFGGPKWIICTGYLNLNTPSLYDR